MPGMFLVAALYFHGVILRVDPCYCNTLGSEVGYFALYFRASVATPKDFTRTSLPSGRKLEATSSWTCLQVKSPQTWGVCCGVGSSQIATGNS